MADDTFGNVMNDPSWRSSGRFYGKYRGMVRDNKDPDKRGRILAEVPAVSGLKTNWANPCTPYAGKDVGFYTMPPVGAKVWIEFEGGNPNFPIWSGCFWQADEVPTEVGNNSKDPSQVKVFKTRVMTLWVDDTDQKGQVVVQFEDSSISDAAKVKLVLDAKGLTITVAGSEETSTITQKPDLVDTNSKTLSTTSTQDTTFTAQKNLTAKVTQDATINASGNAKFTASKDLTAQGQNASVKGNQSLSLQGASASLEGSSSVAVKGGAASFEASGIATVKGSMVNIN